jgi:hypothetical protein
MTTPEERQRQALMAEAVEFTKRLRTSQDTGWVEARKRLEGEGVDPLDAAIATIFPDDTNLIYGVVLTRDDRCFYLSFEYHADAPWELLEWGHVSAKLRGAYERDLPYAREILDSDRRRGDRESTLPE